MNILAVKVGEPAIKSLADFGEALAGAQAGRDVAPYFGIGFATMAQFGTVFTPKRWELVEALKAAGPLSIYALAKRLNRHYRNVHKDVVALLEWMVIEKDEAGKVLVPWDEIDVKWPLLRRAA
ncbi:HTH domain-containing protein [Propionivibrio sp.]|uniref:HVO_A0114 family putative DNA-binding protein n=1 Tax=Propionivibrio sp. TaxID=2212460 RepID=UPI002620A5E2|nr:HTH domain-containing protein [Propionivibrio sp.]